MMVRLLINLARGVLVCVTACVGHAAVSEEPTPGALRAVETLSSDRLGVDHHGHLWSWNLSTGVVQSVTPAGSLLPPQKLESCEAIDHDSEWGTLCLTSQGFEVLVLSRHGTSSVRIPLETEVKEVAWIDRETFAASPTISPHRVELWSTPDAKRVTVMGSEPEIELREGAVRKRWVWLLFRHEEGRLYTLESFEGTLEVFGRDGDLLAESHLVHPDYERLSEWLAEHDREALKASELKPLTVALWTSLMVNADGRTILNRRCNEAEGTLELAQVDRDGSIEMVSLSGIECCASTSQLWGDWIITYRGSGDPRIVCTEARRMPWMSVFRRSWFSAGVHVLVAAVFVTSRHWVLRD
jgi:hypothetical protein